MAAIAHAIIVASAVRAAVRQIAMVHRAVIATTHRAVLRARHTALAVRARRAVIIAVTAVEAVVAIRQVVAMAVAEPLHEADNRRWIY